VPPLTGCSLLTDDEVDEAMGVLDLLPRGLFEFGRGEGCGWQPTDGDGEDIEGLSVQVAPGDPSDFQPAAELDGVRGVPVAGVGEAAVWFGGTDTGTLSVVEGTRLGYLFVRIELNRADVDDSTRLELAKGLAANALPRFPGAPPAEPVVTEFEREPPDVSDMSFVDNLLAREVAGEWTRGEGLAATLRLFAGEVEATDVLRHPQVLDSSGMGIVRLAREYLEAGPDQEAKTEIARLLDLVLFSADELESMAGLGSLIALISGHAALGPIAQQGNVDLCQEVWGQPGPCLVPVVSQELEDLFGIGKYEVYAPEPLQDGWTETHVAWVVEAMAESAKTYELLGNMPPVNIMLEPYPGPTHSVVDNLGDEMCFVGLRTSMQSLPEAQFQQWVAGDLAHCFIAATFQTHAEVGYEVIRWWNHALAVYLSNVVYPGPRCGGPRCDLEWLFLPSALSERELQTSLLERTSDNWLFFQHLAWLIENDGLVDLLGTMPAGADNAQHEAALAAYTDMPTLFHLFVRDLTDAAVEDTGGGPVPYEPRADIVNVNGPHLVLEEPQPFGSTRLHLVVAAGRHACIEYERAGEFLSSWRSGVPGGSGIWSDELPDVLNGDAVIIATTTTSGAELTIHVTDVVDDPDDCAEPDDGAPDANGDCLIGLCGPSDYYRFREQLPEWLQDLLPPLR
jgi:hypothetical protein